MMENVILFIIVATGCVTCYFTGVWEERKQWNELISKGILPKPGLGQKGFLKRLRNDNEGN
jgi:hypothetical protein